MNKAEYIDFEKEKQELEEQKKLSNNNKNLLFKIISKTHNFMEFALAMFAIYIIVTIKWSWIKIVMLTCLGFYVITTLIVIYVMTRIEINKRFK